MPTVANNNWAEPALWAKAVMYTGHALRSERDSWLYPFWSALALEFLARTALASVSPTLLADTSTADISNLLYALGKATSSSNVKSIGTADVLARCEKLFPGFTGEHKKFCAGFTAHRNDELHSGGMPFATLKTQTWLPRYYEACKALLVAMNRDLSHLFGPEAAAAEKMIAALHDDAAKQVRQAISARRTIWEEKSTQEKEAAKKAAQVAASRNLGHVVECPACKCKALVTGEEISQQPPAIEGNSVAVRSTMLPTAFECTGCGLKIRGHNQLHASELGDTYVSTVHWDPIDYYAHLDDDGPEPDNNE